MKQKNKNMTYIELIHNHDFDQATWICLFHGYGASADDLYPLHRELDPEQKYNWIFPQAPLQIPLDLFSKGYAWWPVDIMRYQQAVLSKNFSEVAKHCPEQLEPLKLAFSNLLNEKQISWKNLVIGGFSQGAMLATHLGLNAPENPKGLMLFSGTLICQDTWKMQTPTRKGTPFFQSHGSTDPVLSYGQAQRLYQLLKESGLTGRLQTFPGGHEIPSEVIEQARGFLLHCVTL